MNKNNDTIINQIKHVKARVTIITPTYNRASLIELTMKSVMKQDYKDYIYIILDDGSTDNTKEVVMDLIKGKKNCFYLYHNNIGEAETVNIGWSLCKGEYFVQVNSDDTIEPNLLSEMVKVLDKKPECVAAYPDFYIINDAGDVIEDFKNVDWNFIDALSAFSCYAAAPGAFIRKSAFKHLNKIKDGKYKYINDINMLWDMALVGDFVHIPKSLASWRSHTDGISIDRYKSIEEVRDWVDEYFSHEDLPKGIKDIENSCRQSIDMYCARLIENSDAETIETKYVKDLSKKYHALFEQNMRLIDENKILRIEKNKLESGLEEFEQSFSWKVTRPFRRVVVLLRRLVKI